MVTSAHLFIDEVGTHDLKAVENDPNRRYLSLTGVITFEEKHRTFIQPTLDTIKTEFFGHNVNNPVILHRREVIRREGSFGVLNNPDISKAFDAKILKFVEDAPFICITVVIDKKEHLDRYSVWRFDPYHYCLHCLIERYVLWLRRHSLQGDVIIEPRYKLVDKKLKNTFKDLYMNGTENLPVKDVQKYLLSKEIKLSPKSENLAGIQLCDLIAYPSAKAMRQKREGLPLSEDFGGRIYKILESSKLARNPSSLVIDGWGRKWLP